MGNEILMGIFGFESLSQDILDSLNILSAAKKFVSEFFWYGVHLALINPKT